MQPHGERDREAPDASASRSWPRLQLRNVELHHLPTTGPVADFFRRQELPSTPDDLSQVMRFCMKKKDGEAAMELVRACFDQARGPDGVLTLSLGYPAAGDEQGPLTDDDLKFVVRCLLEEQAPHLPGKSITLDLSGNQITERGLRRLGKCLRNHPEVQGLDVSRNRQLAGLPPPKGATPRRTVHKTLTSPRSGKTPRRPDDAITELLASCTLRHLGLNGIPFAKDARQRIVKEAFACATLCELGMSDCALSKEDMEALVMGDRRERWTHLGIGRTLTNEMVTLIVTKLLRDNKTLVSLDLGTTEPYSSLEFTEVFRELCSNSKLEKLSLAGHTLWGKLPVVTDALRRNTCLQTLDLSRCTFPVEFLGALVKSLDPTPDSPPNKTLTQLVLPSFDGTTDDSDERLWLGRLCAIAIERNKQLAIERNSQHSDSDPHHSQPPALHMNPNKFILPSPRRVIEIVSSPRHQGGATQALSAEQLLGMDAPPLSSEHAQQMMREFPALCRGDVSAFAKDPARLLPLERACAQAPAGELLAWAYLRLQQHHGLPRRALFQPPSPVDTPSSGPALGDSHAKFVMLWLMQWQDALPELKSIDLSGFTLGSKAAHVAKLIGKLKIERIHLGGKCLTDVQVTDWCKALRNAPWLQTVDLSGTGLPAKKLIRVVRAIESNPGVVNVDLRALGNPSAAWTCGTTLVKKPGLKSLNLGGNRYHEEGFAEFAEALASNKSLQFLGLSNCVLDVRSVWSELVPALKMHPTLRKLELGDLKITLGDALEGFARWLSTSTLTYLDLHSKSAIEKVQADPRSYEILLEALAENTSIEFLDLSGRALGSDSEAALVKIIEVHLRLQVLLLNQCGIAASQELADAVERCETLTSLKLNAVNLRPGSQAWQAWERIDGILKTRRGAEERSRREVLAQGALGRMAPTSVPEDVLAQITKYADPVTLRDLAYAYPQKPSQKQ